jgi:hypothetical protein
MKFSNAPVSTIAASLESPITASYTNPHLRDVFVTVTRYGKADSSPTVANAITLRGGGSGHLGSNQMSTALPTEQALPFLLNICAWFEYCRIRTIPFSAGVHGSIAPLECGTMMSALVVHGLAFFAFR